MLYIVKWRDSGKYYNKVTRKFDCDRDGASIINETELEMMYYKYDDDIVEESI
jgi:hypothetical protein